MAVYSHNLKIILVDTNGNVISDNDYLDEIKNSLCKLNTKKVKWNSKNIDISIEWKRKVLDNIESHFVGDLYSNPAYDSDSIIVNHTTQMISNINNNSSYKIKFYISRIIGDKSICKDSYNL